MKEIKVYTHEEMLNRVIGEKILLHVRNTKQILITFSTIAFALPT